MWNSHASKAAYQRFCYSTHAAHQTSEQCYSVGLDLQQRKHARVHVRCRQPTRCASRSIPHSIHERIASTTDQRLHLSMACCSRSGCFNRRTCTASSEAYSHSCSVV